MTPVAEAGRTAEGAAVCCNAAAATETGVGTAIFTAGGAAAIEAGGDAGLAGATTLLGAVIVADATGATDGTAAARTLVTIARAATGVASGSLGRSIKDSTTPAPAVAPIAVATKTTRAVRAKLGAGTK